jgi:hypothetical protein
LEKFFEAYDEATDFACTWFDSELKTTFDIDVYDHPFRHEKGYTIIRNARADVLVLRVEDLSRCFEASVREFLGLGQSVEIPMLRMNTASERRVLNAYRYASEKLRLGRTTCEQVYSSRYARHFYSDAEIGGFVARWSRGETKDAGSARQT